MSSKNDKRRELFQSLPQKEQDYISRYGWGMWKRKEKARLEAEMENDMEKAEETGEIESQARQIIWETSEKFKQANAMYEEALSKVEDNAKLKKGMELYQFRLSEALQSEKKIKAEYEERFKKFFEEQEKLEEERISAPLPKGADRELFSTIFLLTAKIVIELTKLENGKGCGFSFLNEGDKIKFLGEGFTFALPETPVEMEEKVLKFLEKRRQEHESSEQKKSEAPQTVPEQKSAE
jgi:hypothetical protein